MEINSKQNGYFSTSGGATSLLFGRFIELTLLKLLGVVGPPFFELT